MRTELIESIGDLVRRQAAAHGKRAPFIEDDRIVSYAEVPTAFIVCKEGASLAEAALLAHCRRQIAAYKLPRVVAFVPELPKTASGTVQRFVLRAGG